MISLEGFREAFLHLPSGVREAEVNAEIANTLTVAVADGVRTAADYAESTELFLRVSGQKTGYAYTQNPEDNPEELIRKAYQNSFFSENEKPDPMNRVAMCKDYGEAYAEMDIGILEQTALALEQAVRKRMSGLEQSFTMEVTLQAVTHGMVVCNSNGIFVRNIQPRYLLNLFAAVPDADALLTLSSAFLDEFDLNYVSENLVSRIQWQLLEEAPFSAGTYPVILSEEFVYTLMATAWQAFSAEKAQQSASVFCGKQGERIAAPCLSITDYCDLRHSGFLCSCDAEGSEGKDVPVVVDGVLNMFLANCATGRSTGNAGRRPLLTGNIATDIQITPKNFCIEPGKASLSEMERNMGNGILLTEHFDLYHSLDIASGSFSIPCFGVKIENGKETGKLTGLTVSGNLRELFLGIQEVGNSQRIRPMDYTNNYGIGACALRIDRLCVSGEARGTV